MALVKTFRQFTCIETKKVFDLYSDSDANHYELIYNNSKSGSDLANGTTINGFYIAAHDDTEIKLNNGKKILVPRGCFYNLKEGEDVTHRRFTALKMNFKKI